MTSSPKTIMIADGDAAVARLARQALEAEGFEVLVSGDGIEALVAATAAPPDLIVLDADLPRMDGFEVLRLLTGQPGTGKIPVVMLIPRASDARGMRQAAGDRETAWLTQPFPPRELARTVHSLLRERKLTWSDRMDLAVDELLPPD